MSDEVNLSEVLIRLGGIEATLKGINDRLDKGADKKDILFSKTASHDADIAAIKAKQGILLWVIGSIGVAVITQFFMMLGKVQ